MATIIQQPDSLSFCGNLKKFILSTDVTTPFSLKMGEQVIVTNFYNPSVGGLIEIDLREIIERLLSVILPTSGEAVTSQASAFADFTAYIGADPYEFRVIKGGVSGLQELASEFVEDHFLSWQAQQKKILHYQPEWLTIYATEDRIVKCQAYFQDAGSSGGNASSNPSSSQSVTLATVSQNSMQTIDVSWCAIVDALSGLHPVAWDIWFEDNSAVRLSYIQRYQLRNSTAEENLFLWTNTLGGVDSVSFNGSAETDRKLEHLVAELYDESLDQYQTEKKEEIKQSTGFVTHRESIWLEDFFYARGRFKVEKDGSVKPIILSSSKVVTSTAEDLFNYEFTFRYSSTSNLLNLDRVIDDLPAPEGLDDFFLFSPLSGQPFASYNSNLEMAVQSPFAQGWMKLSFAQLWGGALPELVDNKTIRFFNGKLRTDVGVIVESRKPKHGFEQAKDSILTFENNGLSFTITGVDFKTWNMGELMLKNTETISIANIPGEWYISYRDSTINNQLVNVLTASLHPWDRDKDLPIAKIKWDGSLATLIDNRYAFIEVNHALLTRFEELPHPAVDIFTDYSGFKNLLTDKETTVQKALDKLDRHKHWKIYTPDLLNDFVFTSLIDGKPTLNILGDIIQNGSAYETHAEQIYTKDDLIILRDGAVSGLGSGQYAGLKAKLYDGINDGSLVFDGLGIARVGDVGDEQPIATRIELPTDKQFAYWESDHSRLNFKFLDTSFIAENTNLYYKDSRVRAAISETIPGISYDNTTGIFSLTSGYVIPSTSQESNWNTAFGWGNHATVGYVTGTPWTTMGYITGTPWTSQGYVTGTPWTGMGYLTSQISHADVVQDGDFTSQGIMLRNSTSGSYSVLANNSANWNTAFGWGNHATIGYVTGTPWASMNYVTGTPWASMGYITGTPWTAQGYVTGTPWTGMGYLTSQISHADVLQDGDFTSQGIMLRNSASGSYSVLADNSANWNTAFGWGNHATFGYVTGTPWTSMGYITGTPWTSQGYVTGTPWTGMGYLTSQISHADVVQDGDFTSQGIMLRNSVSGSYSVLADNSANWNTAVGWGNHATFGYVTGSPWTTMGYITGTPWTNQGYVTGTPWTGMGYLTSQISHADVVQDGDFTSQGIMLRNSTSGSYSILANNSANWNTAFGWGNHALAGYVTGTPWANMGYVTGTPWTAMGYITGTPWTSAGYQAGDADLTAIAALSATEGFLKKTAANTWTLDTNIVVNDGASTKTATIVTLTQAAYTALPTKVATTLYVIVG